MHVDVFKSYPPRKLNVKFSDDISIKSYHLNQLLLFLRTSINKTINSGSFPGMLLCYRHVCQHLNQLIFWWNHLTDFDEIKLKKTFYIIIEKVNVNVILLTFDYVFNYN